MDVARVDPRDQTWEVDQPRYRVYFSEPSGSIDEYELRSVDVPEVLLLAEAECQGRTFVVYPGSTDGPALPRTEIETLPVNPMRSTYRLMSSRSFPGVK